MDFAFGVRPWSHLRSSLSSICRSNLLCYCVHELGFTHFNFHKDVMDLDPGSPYEAISFSHGGIHADVRMCEIMACGWGPLMDACEGPDGGRGRGWGDNL